MSDQIKFFPPRHPDSTSQHGMSWNAKNDETDLNVNFYLSLNSKWCTWSEAAGGHCATKCENKNLFCVFLFLQYHQKVGNLDSRQPVEYSSYPIMYITQQYTVLNSNKLFSLYIDFLIYRYIDRERAYSYCGCWKRTRHII